MRVRSTFINLPPSIFILPSLLQPRRPAGRPRGLLLSPRLNQVPKQPLGPGEGQVDQPWLALTCQNTLKCKRGEPIPLVLPFRKKSPKIYGT